MTGQLAVDYFANWRAIHDPMDLTVFNQAGYGGPVALRERPRPFLLPATYGFFGVKGSTL